MGTEINLEGLLGPIEDIHVALVHEEDGTFFNTIRISPELFSKVVNIPNSDRSTYVYEAKSRSQTPTPLAIFEEMEGQLRGSKDLKKVKKLMENAQLVVLTPGDDSFDSVEVYDLIGDRWTKRVSSPPSMESTPSPVLFEDAERSSSAQSLASASSGSSTSINPSVVYRTYVHTLHILSHAYGKMKASDPNSLKEKTKEAEKDLLKLFQKTVSYRIEHTEDAYVNYQGEQDPIPRSIHESALELFYQSNAEELYSELEILCEMQELTGQGHFSKEETAQILRKLEGLKISYPNNKQISEMHLKASLLAHVIEMQTTSDPELELVAFEKSILDIRKRILSPEKGDPMTKEELFELLVEYEAKFMKVTSERFPSKTFMHAFQAQVEKHFCHLFETLSIDSPYLVKKMVEKLNLELNLYSLLVGKDEESQTPRRFVGEQDLETSIARVVLYAKMMSHLAGVGIEQAEVQEEYEQAIAAYMDFCMQVVEEHEGYIESLLQTQNEIVSYLLHKLQWTDDPKLQESLFSFAKRGMDLLKHPSVVRSKSQRVNTLRRVIPKIYQQMLHIYFSQEQTRALAHMDELNLFATFAQEQQSSQEELLEAKAMLEENLKILSKQQEKNLEFECKFVGLKVKLAQLDLSLFKMGLREGLCSEHQMKEELLELQAKAAEALESQNGVLIQALFELAAEYERMAAQNSFDMNVTKVRNELEKALYALDPMAQERAAEESWAALSLILNGLEEGDSSSKEAIEEAEIEHQRLECLMESMPSHQTSQMAKEAIAVHKQIKEKADQLELEREFASLKVPTHEPEVRQQHIEIVRAPKATKRKMAFKPVTSEFA